MKPRLFRQRFPGLRVLMLTFMLLSTFSPLWQGASAGENLDTGRLAAFQDPTGQLCHDLDTDNNLHLSEEERGALAGDPYNYTDEQIAEVASFCEGLPSMSADQLAADNNGPTSPNDQGSNENSIQSHTGLTITKTATTDTVAPGGLLTFVITVASASFFPSVVDITDALPAGFTWTELDPRCSIIAGNLICENVQVSSITPITVQVSAAVPQTATCGAVISNTAVLRNQQGAEIHSATDSVTVACRLFNVNVVKLFCIADAVTAPVLGLPGVDDECRPATEAELAALDLELTGGTLTAPILTADLVAGVQLPAGTYFLAEAGVRVGGPIVITGNTTLTLRNFELAPVFDVNLVKLFCIADAVTAPVLGLPGVDDECRPATEAELAALDLELTGGVLTAPILTADLLAGVQLPAGTYILTEAGVQVGDPIVITGDVTLTLRNFELDTTVPPAEITILKRFCEEDISGNDTCNGRVDVAGETATFEVTNAGGALLDTIVVTVGDQGDGSQGSDPGAGLLAGTVVTICETATSVDGTVGVPFPRDDDGDSCVTVTLTPGNNQIQFNNFRGEAPVFDVNLVKLFCIADAVTAPVLGLPGVDDECRPATEAELAALDLELTGGVLTAPILTADLLAGVQLPAGTYILTEAGVQVGDPIVITADVTLTLRNFELAPVFDVNLVKLFCIADAVTAPVLGLPGEGEECRPATEAELAALDLELTGGVLTAPILTADLLAGVELPAGTYILTEGGVQVGDPIVITGDVTLTLRNFELAPDAEPTITILKRFCEEDRSQSPNDNCTGRVSVPSDTEVVFTVYEGEGTDGTVVGTIVVTDFDQGNGSQDSASSGFELVEGETYTVCEEPLMGWDGEPRPDPQGGANQTELGDCIVVTLTPGNNVLQFVNYEDMVPGTVIVVKYFCEDADITVPVVGDDDSDYDDCTLATAEQLEGVNFLIYPFGVEADAIDVDDTALLTTGVELPVGTHTLVEVFNGEVYELATITVTAGGTVTYAVFNPIEMEENITLNIYKLVCSGFSEKHEDGCVESDELDGTEIEFTVTYTIGDVETTVETSLVINASEGSAVLTLPVADFYTVCEIVPEGVEGILFVVPGFDAVADENGCITFSGENLSDGDIVNVTFWNDMVDKKPVTPEKPEKPVKPAPVKPVPAKTVTGLPNTGSGDTGNDANVALYLLSGVTVLAGVGAFIMKDRERRAA